jgi:hypothetical protein
VGDALRRDQNLLGELERLAVGTRGSGFHKELNALAPNLVGVEALRTFLKEEPRLGKHGQALARLAQ